MRMKQIYISPDNYSGMAVIVDKEHKKELVYDCLGVTEYHFTRFKTSDISPCVCVTKEELFRHMDRIDQEYARGIHRHILAIPIKDVDPDSKWVFVSARRFDDGHMTIITSHKNYDGQYEYAITVIDCTDQGHQYWSWHRLECEPVFKKDGVDLTEDEVHKEILAYIDTKIKTAHETIRSFIEESD